MLGIDTCGAVTLSVKDTSHWSHAEDWVDSAIQIIRGSTLKDKELSECLAPEMQLHLREFADKYGLTVPNYEDSLKASIERLPNLTPQSVSSTRWPTVPSNQPNHSV